MLNISMLLIFIGGMLAGSSNDIYILISGGLLAMIGGWFIIFRYDNVR